MSKTNTLKKLNRTYPNIMADIEKVLDKKKIQCETSRSEIVAIGTKKKSIKDLITPLVSNEDDFKLLIDIIEAKGNVYIRKKCG